MQNSNYIFSAAIAISAIAGIGAASAADLPARTYTKAPVMVDPANNWSGFYVGATAGGHWSNVSVDPVLTDPAVFFAAGSGPIIRSFSQTTQHPSGFAGGVEAGFNWQTGQFVFGVEGDFTWLNGGANRALTGFPAPVVVGDFETNSANARYLATIRPRAGISFFDNRALAYVSGGVAFARLNTSDLFSATGGTNPAGVNATFNRTGWTVGGGLEYMITRNWSVKGEYLYADLGTVNAVAPTFPAPAAPTTFITYSHRFTENIARAGLNYKFDSAKF
jgi:outer membrane immunogenic protein